MPKWCAPRAGSSTTILVNGAELYDLANDPGETRNLYAQNSRSEIAHEMKPQLLDWLITADETDQIASKWVI
jgi:hypothetical protein